MALINRVRLHNVRYDKEDRFLDNLVLDLRGNSSLMILENGGGKSLVLQLIIQCICPNTPFQGRPLSGLFKDRQFTGHVLVEWLLDGGRPSYILTGFCFAENLGQAKQPIDYFNYISADVYADPNPWDLERFPLLDDSGHTLNYRELRDHLTLSGGKIRTFAADRSQEYQRNLFSYGINYREWEQVLSTNVTEGGINKYFEGCTRTRSLLEKMIFPTIDRVVKRGADEEHDDLIRTFKQYSEELMRLPVFQANLQALEQMALHIPKLKNALAKIAESTLDAKAAVAERQALYSTLRAGMPHLNDDILRLGKEKNALDDKKETVIFLLESVECESLRRQWQLLQEELAVKNGQLENALQAKAEAENVLHRRQAWRYYGEWRTKKANLQRDEERRRVLLQGREGIEQEIDCLRPPLLRHHNPRMMFLAICGKNSSRLQRKKDSISRKSMTAKSDVPDLRARARDLWRSRSFWHRI
jgi:hypothetical protein